MKRAKLLILLFFLTNYSFAQNKDLNLADLKAPSSPSFTILGIQPNEISRPKSFRALETELLTNFIQEGNEFILPNNYALEISPYWLLSHPNMSFQNYANPTIGQAITRSLSFSFSTNQENLSDSLTLNNFGLGARFNIDFRKIDDLRLQTAYDNLSISQSVNSILGVLFNRINKNITSFSDSSEAINYVNSLSTSLAESIQYEESKKLFLFGISKLIVIIKELYGTNNESKLSDFDYMNNIRDKIEEKIKLQDELRDKAKILSETIQQKHGFNLEVAFATKYSISNRSDLAKSDFKKYGIWITPSFTFEKLNFIEFLGVLRFMKNDTQDIPNIDLNDLENIVPDNFSKNLDYGARFVITSPDEEKVPFSLSFELIGREQWITVSEEEIGDTTVKQTVSQSDSRLSFSFEYQISNNMNLTYSIGRLFDKNTTQDESIFSLAGISFGFGGKKASDYTQL